MNRSRRHDKTAAEKLELLDRYKTFTFMSQREAADRLGIGRGCLQGLIKNEAPYTFFRHCEWDET